MWSALVERFKLCMETDFEKVPRQMSLDAYSEETLLGRRKLFGADRKVRCDMIRESMLDPGDDWYKLAPCFE